MSIYCNNIFIDGGTANDLKRIYDLVRSGYDENDDRGAQWLKEAMNKNGTNCTVEEMLLGEKYLNLILKTSWLPSNEAWHKIIENFAPNCCFHSLVDKANDQDKYLFKPVFVEEDKGATQIKSDIDCGGDDEESTYEEELPEWLSDFIYQELCTRDYFRKKIVPIFGDKPTSELIDLCNTYIEQEFNPYEIYCEIKACDR